VSERAHEFLFGIEVGRIDYQRVACPPSNRVAEPQAYVRREMLSFGIDWDDARLPAHLVENRGVTRRLEDLEVGVVAVAIVRQLRQPPAQAPLHGVAIFRIVRPHPAAIVAAFKAVDDAISGLAAGNQTAADERCRSADPPGRLRPLAVLPQRLRRVGWDAAVRRIDDERRAVRRLELDAAVVP